LPGKAIPGLEMDQITWLNSKHWLMGASKTIGVMIAREVMIGFLK